MNVYIAAQDKEQALDIRAMLFDNAKDVEFSCRWLDQEFKRTLTYTEEERNVIATQCYEDIDKCDVLILLASDNKMKCSGGKFVEAGYALGQNKDVIILGQPENMLLWARKNIKAVQTISQLLSNINALSESHRIRNAELNA